MTTKEDLLSRYGRRVESLTVEGVGEFRVQSLSESEKATYEGTWFDKNGKVIERKFRLRKALLLSLTLLDENGARMFPDEEVESLDLCPSFVDPMFTAVQRFCRMKTDDEVVEERKKNSDSPPDSNS